VTVVAEAPVEGLTPVRVAADGTFWQRPGPRDPLFLEVGGSVAVGATIGLLEVMKTFAPVRSASAGVLERYAAADGQAVNAGDVVAWLKAGP
jgi:biotin carboxyl carrier protein